MIEVLLGYPMDAEIKPTFCFKGGWCNEFDAEFYGRAYYEDKNELELKVQGTGTGRAITPEGLKEFKIKDEVTEWH